MYTLYPFLGRHVSHARLATISNSLLVGGLSFEERRPCCFGHLIEDTRQSLGRFQFFSVKHIKIKREANKAAYCLAKILAISQLLDKIWMQEGWASLILSYIQDVILAEQDILA